MKVFIAVLCFMVQVQMSYAGGISSNGDCFPEQFNLPNQGANCTRVATFPVQNEPQEYQLWSCPQKQSEKLYLMKFKVISESGEFKGCRVFLELTEQQ